MKYWLASVTWGVIAAVVMGICGSAAFAYAMGWVLGIGCLAMAILACAVGPGGVDGPVVIGEEAKTTKIDTVA